MASNKTAIDATVSPEPEVQVVPASPAAEGTGAGSRAEVAEAAVRARRRLKLVEERTLSEVLAEGAERVARLSECFNNASNNGLFGREAEVTSCRCAGRWRPEAGRRQALAIFFRWNVFVSVG